ncbi:MAG: hypothetical protein EOO60_04750 [Hymenobacter sp.]|nr:MAG: hypothetical protein EOO60_04750 [Hymenobacter sp.]
MFDLFIIALLQFATLSGNVPANKIGAAGWENDFAPTTNKIGAAGWENDKTAPTTTNAIGAAGWEND